MTSSLVLHPISPRHTYCHVPPMITGLPQLGTSSQSDESQKESLQNLAKIHKGFTDLKVSLEGLKNLEKSLISESEELRTVDIPYYESLKKKYPSDKESISHKLAELDISYKELCFTTNEFTTFIKASTTISEIAGRMIETKAIKGADIKECEKQIAISTQKRKSVEDTLSTPLNNEALNKHSQQLTDRLDAHRKILDAMKGVMDVV